MPLRLEDPKQFHPQFITRGTTHTNSIEELYIAHYFTHFIFSAVYGLCIHQLCKSDAIRHHATEVDEFKLNRN